MARAKLGLILLGLVLVTYGANEIRLGWGVSREPVDVDLTQLQPGQMPQNRHVRIGPHLAIYTDKFCDSSGSKYCYYPIVPLIHPFAQAVARKDRSPTLAAFLVVVKSRDLASLAMLAFSSGNSDEVQGIIVNGVDNFTTDDRNYLRRHFPQLEIDKVLILEEGRGPPNILWSLGIILAGLATAFVGGMVLANSTDK